MDLAYKAVSDAMYFHQTQIDKAGQPYFFHVIYVALSLQDADVPTKIAALLHDSVEDGHCTLNYIKEVYGNEIAQYVDTLTRRDTETYFEYINRIKNSGLQNCIEIKKADLKHNMQLDRFDVPSTADIIRCNRYKKALRILEATNDTVEFDG